MDSGERSNLAGVDRRYWFGEGQNGMQEEIPDKKENRHDGGVDVSMDIDRSNIPAVLSADVNSPM